MREADMVRNEIKNEIKNELNFDKEIISSNIGVKDFRYRAKELQESEPLRTTSVSHQNDGKRNFCKYGCRVISEYLTIKKKNFTSQ